MTHQNQFTEENAIAAIRTDCLRQTQTAQTKLNDVFECLGDEIDSSSAVLWRPLPFCCVAADRINVDDFVAVETHELNRIQHDSRSAHKRFNVNHLRSTRIRKFQEALESGSGPGGRMFKSSLPAMTIASFEGSIEVKVVVRNVVTMH